MADQVKPRRTWASNKVFRLEGGTEDNDLWVYDDGARLVSTFVPTDEQRRRIAEGANIDVVLWSRLQPPIAVSLDAITQIGKVPEDPREILRRSPVVTGATTAYVWLGHAETPKAALEAAHEVLGEDQELFCKRQAVAMRHVEHVRWEECEAADEDAELFWQLDRRGGGG